MTRALRLIATVICLTVSLGAQQSESTEKAIRLRFPSGIDLTNLSINYFRDPVVARYPEQRGNIMLRVRGTTDLQIQDAQKLGQGVRIPISSSYPGNLQLVAVR